MSENQPEKPYGVSNFSNFEQNQHIRIIEKEDGTPWFVAKDLCRNLGLTNVSMAVKGNPKTGDRGLDSDEIASIRISDTSSSTRNSITALCVNESGMYALTFKSRKPQAVKFRKWVTSEVLPSIRKTGAYATRENMLLTLATDLLQKGYTHSEATRIICKGHVPSKTMRQTEIEILSTDHTYIAPDGTALHKDAAIILSQMQPGIRYTIAEILPFIPKKSPIREANKQKGIRIALGRFMRKLVEIGKVRKILVGQYVKYTLEGQ